jgi:outer membrane protein assembly factor BamA
VIFDQSKTEKSVVRLQYNYFNKGYFDVSANYTLDTINLKKIKVKYTITTGNPYIIDSLITNISSPKLDSLYQITKSASLIKPGSQYKTEDFENEKNRITTQFRNNGAYHFQPNNVTFDIDTIHKKNKATVSLKISDYSYQEKDSAKTAPFKLFKISDVTIYTDYSAADANAPITDTTRFNNFNLFSKNKLKYNPKAITNAVFITKGGLFSDTKTTLTSRYLSNLKIFNYPSIIYEIDKKDSTAQSLVAKIYLTPKKQ